MKLSLEPGVTNGSVIEHRISNYYGGKFMNLRDIFSRNNGTSQVTSNFSKHEVSCDTPELKELITMWTKKEGLKFENFIDFIKLVGIQTPIKLSKLNKKNNTFNCLTALNTEVMISLRFGNGWDYCSEIHVTEENEFRRYIATCNTEKGNLVPSVTLQSKVIKKNGKELKCIYGEDFCNRTLKIDDTHILQIEINEPKKSNEKSEILVLQSYKNVENYLLGLHDSFVLSQVYDKILQFLCFSVEDISSSPKILISYNESDDKEERVLSKILITNGTMQEYAIMENRETFHVFRNGNWIFSSGSMKISYSEEKKHFIFSITGTEENITNVIPFEIMSRVKKKISELWKYVK